MVELVLFIIFGLAALFGAVTTVWARNPVYSALGLMLTLFSVAVFYVSNGAQFVAAVQVIVYAGAVMTLFLFVIMLVGVDRAEDRRENLPVQRPLALGLLVLFGAGVLVAGRFAWVTGAEGGRGAEGTVEALGSELFRRWVLPFELTALLLIIAAAGTVALGLFRRGEAEGGDEGEAGEGEEAP
ncbi:MAG: NADH-quinone oxidoreductase subunit J [Acidimicrobiia bacterium]|nr:NADH-quinone oxidoreductase subunit J [Acidimicrobiia bacterium]